MIETLKKDIAIMEMGIEHNKTLLKDIIDKSGYIVLKIEEA